MTKTKDCAPPPDSDRALTSPTDGAQLRQFKYEYWVFIFQEADARVDAGGIPPRWREPGGLEIAWTYFEKLSKGSDAILRADINRRYA
jgi:hypothetical protein